MVDVVLGNTRGLTGADGSPGADAPIITDIEKTGSVGLVDTYTITLSDGSEYTFEVTNGSDGSSVSISQIVSSGTKIATLTIDGVSTDLYSPSGGSADIVTTWEQVLSDLKVPSEKLTKETIDTKVDKVSGKGLSTNDYTTTEKDKLAGIESGANKTIVDDSLSSSSSNPVENNVINTALASKQATLVSGTNIKTVNNESLLGSGDITITGADIGTFTDLQTLINDTSSGGILILDKDYQYDSTTDSNLLLECVEISKNITIIGNGHIIDGNNSKRAFYIQDYIVNLYDLRIQNCNSNGDGGAIFIYGGATVYISNMQFINNNATNYGNGGAICIDYDATVKINNTQFNKNIANHYGGAISKDVANVTLKNLSFRDNTASSYANIYSYDTVTVYDCIIPNIATSCYNVSNITTESLYDAIEGLEEDMLL